MFHTNVAVGNLLILNIVVMGLIGLRHQQSVLAKILPSLNLSSPCYNKPCFLFVQEGVIEITNCGRDLYPFLGSFGMVRVMP